VTHLGAFPSMEDEMAPEPMPTLVAHADWGSAPGKRYMALAVLECDRYVRAPEPVGDPRTLLKRLREVAGKSGVILVGSHNKFRLYFSARQF
jgi:hypothetical protein